MWQVVRVPGLWLEAVRALIASVPRRWWSHPPFLPIPNRDYLRWRIATAYGSADASLVGDDVVAYLAWRRRQRRLGAGAS